MRLSWWWLLLLCIPGLVSAQEARVPVSDNFSTPELVGLTLGAVGGTVLYLFEEPLAARMDEPKFGDPGALDVAVSNALYRGPDAGKYLGGAPDFMGAKGGPALAVAYYGGQTLIRGITGRSLTGNPNADHELLVLLEAYGLNMTATEGAKLLIGRERPFYALERDPSQPRDPEWNLSFFSGHSSSSFLLASFVARDVTDFLVAGPLKSQGKGKRLVLGRLLPGAVLYGMAGVVAYSRVVDQRHYLSDVVVGSLVGAGLGNLFYALHFDNLGQPRRRNAERKVQASLVPYPSGLGLVGTF